MKVNIRHLDGPLLWSMWGTVWMTCEITPMPAAVPSVEQEISMLRVTTAMLRQLPKEWLLRSVCERLPPAAVVDGMIRDVDLDRCAAWRDIAAATLEGLAEIPMFRRRFFVSVQLGVEDWQTRVKLIAGSVAADVFRSIPLPEAPVERAQVKRFRSEAASFLQRLDKALAGHHVTPVDPATHAWLYARTPVLGIQDTATPDGWQPRVSWSDPSPTGTGRMEPLQHLWRGVRWREGGAKTDPARRQHRYMRVSSEAGVSYQIYGAVAGMPLEFSYPEGGKWWLAADEFNVDWACRGISIGNSQAQARVRWQYRQLLDQTEQWSADPAGAPGYIAEAISGVNAEMAGLARNPSDPEMQACMIFAKGGADLEAVERDWAEFASSFRNREWPVERPSGGQQQLLQAMLPGSPLPPAARDYMQFFLPCDLAAGLPAAGTDLGDPSGMLFAFTGDKPVLVNETYAIHDLNKSGSMLVVADSGGGKTYAIKSFMHAACARGAQVVTLDCSDIGEYADFAAVVPGSAQVVSVEPGADLSLDPMRVFAGSSRARYTKMLFTHLSRVDPTANAGAVLNKAVNAAVRLPDTTSQDVVDMVYRIANDDRDPNASAAGKLHARIVSLVEQTDLADLVFNRERCVVSLDADYICFHAPHLELPERDAFQGEAALGRLMPEQVVSQALFYLIAAYEREITWSSARWGLWVQDEEWRFERTHAGRAMVDEGLREGRKHKSSMILATQLPTDPRRDVVQLVTSILLLRQAEGSGPDALGLIGRNRRDDELAGVVESFEPGEGLLRDALGRVGHVRIPQAAPRLHIYFSSNPADIAARKAESAAHVGTSAGPDLSGVEAEAPAAQVEPFRVPSGNRRRKRRPPRERRAADAVADDGGGDEEAAFG